MFLRYRIRERHMHLWLAESYRLDGRPHQRHLFTLGSMALWCAPHPRNLGPFLSRCAERMESRGVDEEVALTLLEQVGGLLLTLGFDDKHRYPNGISPEQVKRWEASRVRRNERKRERFWEERRRRQLAPR